MNTLISSMTHGNMVDLDDLWDELQRGKIYESSLRSDKWVMDGLQTGDSVYIDPRPAILETLVHELLHRRKPRLSERAVTNMARKFIGGMDEATKAKWWKAYQRIKRKGPAVDVD
jgi:hypothetical protein